MWPASSFSSSAFSSDTVQRCRREGGKPHSGNRKKELQTLGIDTRQKRDKAERRSRNQLNLANADAAETNLDAVCAEEQRKASNVTRSEISLIQNAPVQYMDTKCTMPD